MHKFFFCEKFFDLFINRQDSTNNTRVKNYAQVENKPLSKFTKYMQKYACAYGYILHLYCFEVS